MPLTKNPFILIHAETGEVRIVKAPSRTAALLHVAAPPWSVAIATTDDLIAHLPTVKVESVGDAPEPAGTAPGEG